MLTDTGRGLPAASALARNTSMWRPGENQTDRVSGPCRHMRWMVTSSSPFSGSFPYRRPIGRHTARRPRGIGGRGDEAAQIESQLVGAVHGFLTRGNSLDGGRLDEVLKGIHEVPAEALRLRAERQEAARLRLESAPMAVPLRRDVPSPY